VIEIEIEDATVSYRDNVVLKNISLKVEKGSFLAVIGPNGAGKTTLLTLINGLGRLFKGRVKIFGKEVNKRNISSIRKEIGYVPQKISIDPRMPFSVYDVIISGRYPKIGLFRRPKAYDREVVDRICKLLGIYHLKDKPVGNLSGGEQQKVLLARALAQEPKILLLDEPTTNLDPQAQHDIIDIIEEIYIRNRLTVIFVTHILEHLPKVCSQAVLLKSGKIIAQGGIPSVFTPRLLSLLYDFPVKPPSVRGE